MIGLALGALSFGSSALGAIGGHSAQSAAARRQNRYALKIYKQQLKARKAQALYRNADYINRKTQYKEQLFNNQSAAQRAYVAEQSRINEVFKQMNFAEQGSQVKEQSELGKLQAREVSGKSAERAQTLLSAGFGRNTAIRQEQLRTTIDVANQRNERTREQLKIANRSSYYKVGAPPINPELPPPPLMQSGPSQMGLFANLGSAALGAVNTFQQYQNYQPGQ